VTASIHPEKASLMIDDNPNTIWTSATTQTPGMTITVDMGAVYPVSELRFDLGDSLCDFQRGSRIEVSTDNQAWQKAFEYANVADGLFWDNNQPRYLVRGTFFTCAFAPVTARYVRIVQTGSDPHFWWTIAELHAFGPPRS